MRFGIVKLKNFVFYLPLRSPFTIFEVPYNGTDNNDYVDGQGFCCDDGSPEAAQARALALENNFQDPDAYEKLQFYYHPDHLGSSSYITNLDGEVVQHIEYVPFGEVFIEERNSIWNTPYLFNAKEFDEETGLYYYGARYYDPRLSLWISVDPKAKEFANVSPYNYVLNSPIKHIDKEGEFPLLSNVIGGLIGAATEYGMQVVGNIYSKGLSLNAFTNVDIADIGIAAGEGFLTSGGSVIKRVATKAVVSVGSEVLRNTIDVKVDAENGFSLGINKTEEIAVNSVVGITTGSIKTNFKPVKVVKTQTANQTIKKARSTAHSKGHTFSAEQARNVAKNTRERNAVGKEINGILTEQKNGFIGNSIGEILEYNSDEPKE